MYSTGNIIELEKPYFGLDKNNRITYNKSEIVGQDDFFYTEYATLSDVREMLYFGYTVFIYPNPDTDDGLWNKIISEGDAIGTKSKIPKRYDYRVICANIKNLIHD